MALKKYSKPGPPDGAGTFSSGASIPVPAGRTLVAFATTGFSATLTAVNRNGTQAAYPPFVGVGYAQRFSGQVVAYVSPSAADANISWLLVPEGQIPFDSPSRSIAAGSSVAAGTALTAGQNTIVYTVPAGVKFFLLSIQVNGTQGDGVAVWIQRNPGVLSDVRDKISDSGLSTLPGSNFFIGHGAENNITLVGDIILMPGDVLYAETLAHNGTAWYLGYTEPL